MKLVIALVASQHWSGVQRALNQVGVGSMVVSEVIDSDPAEGPSEIHRSQVVRRPAARIRVEVVVEDGSLKGAVEGVLRAGGRRVLVMDLDQCAMAQG